MNTSTEKIKTSLTKELEGLFGDSISKDQVDTVKRCIDQRIKRKTSNLYKSWYSMGKLAADASNWLLKEKADSKIEVIFYHLLSDNNIPFKFQYKIGRYKVDFLISDFLAFEIDGPLHKGKEEYDRIRDKYITKMGYEVMRIPVSFIALDSKAVIKDIKQRITKQPIR